MLTRKGKALKITDEVKRAVFAESGRDGGNARASKLTPERRREIAVLAAQARWGKKKGTKKQ